MELGISPSEYRELTLGEIYSLKDCYLEKERRIMIQESQQTVSLINMMGQLAGGRKFQPKKVFDVFPGLEKREDRNDRKEEKSLSKSSTKLISIFKAEEYVRFREEEKRRFEAKCELESYKSRRRARSDKQA